MFVKAPNGRVAVYCLLTGEKISGAFAADTDEGYIDMFTLVDGKIAHEPSVNLPGRTVFPLRTQRQYRPFKLVDRKTGEILAESNRSAPKMYDEKGDLLPD